MRRKTLYNNFRQEARLKEALVSLGYEANVRAEAMSPEARFGSIKRCMRRRTVYVKVNLFYLPNCPHCKIANRCIDELRSEDGPMRTSKSNASTSPHRSAGR